MDWVLSLNQDVPEESVVISSSDQVWLVQQCLRKFSSWLLLISILRYASKKGITFIPRVHFYLVRPVMSMTRVLEPEQFQPTVPLLNEQVFSLLSVVYFRVDGGIFCASRWGGDTADAKSSSRTRGQGSVPSTQDGWVSSLGLHEGEREGRHWPLKLQVIVLFKKKL